MPPQTNTVTPGKYRFTVRSAFEAVEAIRTQLGTNANVVSVRSIKAPGVAGIFGGTRLEVVASVPSEKSQTPAPAGLASQAKFEATSNERIELPEVSNGPATPREAAKTSMTLASERSATFPPAVGSAKPAAPSFETLLRRAGLSEALIERLTHGDRQRLATQPLHQTISELGAKLEKLSRQRTYAPLPLRTAFLGLAGSGRTTALCKWLSAEVFVSSRRGTVVNVELERSHPGEELAVFAELLGQNFSRFPLPQSAIAEGEFCYFDTPSLSLTRPSENTALRRLLDTHEVPGRVLVLSALLEPSLLRQACASGVEVGCTHIAFTHLDDLPQWGKLWDFIIESPLTPLLLTHGPSQSGEYQTDVVGAVLRRTFPWS